MDPLSVWGNINPKRKNDYSNVLYIVPSLYRIKQIENIFLKSKNIKGSFFPPKILTISQFAKEYYIKENNINEISATKWDEYMFDYIFFDILKEIEGPKIGVLTTSEKRKLHNKSSIIGSVVSQMREKYTIEEVEKRITKVKDPLFKEVLRKYVENTKNTRDTATAYDIYDLLERTAGIIKNVLNRYDYIILEEYDKWEPIYQRIFSQIIDNPKIKNVKKAYYKGIEINTDIIGTTTIDEAELIIREITKILSGGNVALSDIGIITNDSAITSSLKILLYQHNIPANVSNNIFQPELFDLMERIGIMGENGIILDDLAYILSSKYIKREDFYLHKNTNVIRRMTGSPIYIDLYNKNPKEEIRKYLKGCKEEHIKKVNLFIDRLKAIDCNIPSFLFNFIQTDEDNDSVDISSKMLVSSVTSSSEYDMDKEGDRREFFSDIKFISQMYKKKWRKRKWDGIDIIPLESAKDVQYKYTFFCGLLSSIETVTPPPFPNNVYEDLGIESVYDRKKREVKEIMDSFYLSEEKTYLSFYRYGLNGKEASPSSLIASVRDVLEKESINAFKNIEKTVFYDSRRTEDEEESKKTDINSFIIYSDVFKEIPVQNMAFDTSIEDKTIIDFRKEFNITEVEEFYKCKFKFFWNFIFTDIYKGEKDITSYKHMERGSFFHKVFEEAGKTDEFRTTKDENIIYNILSEKFDELIETYNFKYTIPCEIEKEKSLLKQFAENEAYYRNADINGFKFEEIKKVEFPVSFKLNDILLKGRIDRIDILKKEDGSKLLLINDYKSRVKDDGKNVVYHGSIKSYQLFMYLYILKNNDEYKDIIKDVTELYGTNVSFYGKRPHITGRISEVRNQLDTFSFNSFIDFINTRIARIWRDVILNVENKGDIIPKCPNSYCEYRPFYDMLKGDNYAR